MQKSDIAELKKQLDTKNEIVIVTHKNPDGDAIGSSLGLWNFLKQIGIKATVIVPNDYPDFLHWLPGNKQVIKYDSQKELARSIVSKAGTIFCLDFNTLKRIEKLGEDVALSNAYKVLIDHHVQPEQFADFYFHDIEACSTAQLVFELIEELSMKNHINTDCSICIYTGIMTDTASFRFPSVKAKTHKIVAQLIEMGATHHTAHENVYDSNTEDRMKLLGFALSEKMIVLKNYNTAYICLTEEELKRFNFKKGDTEGLVNQPLSIKGIIFSAFFMERDGLIKISLRSKGNFDVNKLAREHFNGGGHVNAAGGELNMSMTESVKKLTDLLPNLKQQLM